MPGAPLVLAKPGAKDAVVIIDGDRFRVFNTSDGCFSTPKFTLPSAAQQAKEDASNAAEGGEGDDGGAEESKDTEVAGNQNKKGKGNDKKQIRGGKTPQQPKSQGHEGSKRIINAAFCSNGKYFATIDDLKVLTVFQCDDWSCLNVRFVPRRSTGIAFGADSEFIFVADKSGDVNLFSVTDVSKEPVACIGILSMLLDVVVDGTHKVVITADRDEKIRVSQFPNTYNIQSYCLGHTAMVTCVTLVPSRDGILISGSADGTLRTWKYMNGQELCVKPMSEDEGLQNLETVIVANVVANPSGNGQVAVRLEGEKSVRIYTVDAEGMLKLNESITTPEAVSSLSFSASGDLFVALAADSSPFQMYSTSNENKYKLVDSASIAAINENAVFGDCREPTFMLNDFLKRAFDTGIQSYHERKEKRIAETQAKKKKQGTQPHPKRSASSPEPTDDNTGKRAKTDSEQ